MSSGRGIAVKTGGGRGTSRISANQPVVPDKFTMTEPSPIPSSPPPPPPLSLLRFSHALPFLPSPVFQALMRHIVSSLRDSFCLVDILSLRSSFSTYPLRVIIKRFLISRIVRESGRESGEWMNAISMQVVLLFRIGVRTSVLGACKYVITIHMVEEIMLHR